MILITGSSGFVGRQVLKATIEDNEGLRLVVRDSGSDCTRYSSTASILNTSDLFEESTAWWKEALSGVDTVLHVAWFVEPGEYLSSEENLHCLEGTLRIAKACSEAGVKRFVGVGTCFEYDLSPGFLSPQTPLLPRTLYAACKVSAFQVLQEYFRSRSIEFLWCRLFYMYGDREDSRRLVPYLRSKLSAGEPVELSDGEQVLDFLNVEEVGCQLWKATLSSEQGVKNICSGIPTTVRALAEQIADEYGRRDLLRFGAREKNEFDPSFIVGIQ